MWGELFLFVIKLPGEKRECRSKAGPQTCEVELKGIIESAAYKVLENRWNTTVAESPFRRYLTTSGSVTST